MTVESALEKIGVGETGEEIHLDLLYLPYLDQPTYDSVERKKII